MTCHNGKRRFSVMENDERETGAPDEFAAYGDSAVEATAALAAVQDSALRARAAARPPQWYLLAVSACLTLLIASAALPADIRHLAVAGVTLCEGVIILGFTGRRRAALGPLGVLAPFRGYVIGVVALVVLVVAAMLWSTSPSTQMLLPWWGHLGAGAVIGVLTYIVGDWVWDKWIQHQ